MKVRFTIDNISDKILDLMIDISYVIIEWVKLPILAEGRKMNSI